MTANTPEALAERCLELERLLREKDDELAAVRKALRYGADDLLWPPGQSMGDVVAGLVETRTYFQWQLHKGPSYWLYRIEPQGTTCETVISPTETGKYTLGFNSSLSLLYWTAEEARLALIEQLKKTVPVYAKIIPPLP